MPEEQDDNRLQTNQTNNMRKTAITLLLIISAPLMHAQSAYDGLIFSENNYEGTARSVAMGNAFTALGGDLGAVTINPAGSAVAGYSQISLTPGLTFSASTAQGASPYTDGSLPYFERAIKSRMTKFSLPNMGLTINWDTGRKTGLKNITVGFMANKTADYNQDVYANGMNSTTSFMGAMATEAYGLSAKDLNAKDAYDFMPWSSVVAYQSGMISTFGGYDDQYVGASELVFDNNEIVLGGPLDQSYGRRVTGSKFDYVFNVGANISDFVYIGANLGMTSLEYGYDEYFKEAAIDPDDFEISFQEGTTYFDRMKYRYSYEASGSGYYAKFGAILTPGGGFRIGAAIQTPTINTITERWQQAAETQFRNSSYNGYASSPEGKYSYTFLAPYRANFGIAYTMGGLALISADYEICDFSTMEFRSEGYDQDYFEELNADIRKRFGLSHALRTGAEMRLGAIAVRAGYGFTTSSEKLDGWNRELPVSFRHNLSFGLGYSSKGSFFTDLAVRRNFTTREYYMPYSDYVFDNEDNILDPAPELLISKSDWKVLLTLGWRF